VPRSVLAFGVEPSDRTFRLRLARYPALADAVAAFVRARDPAAGPVRLLDVGVGRGRSLRYVEPLGVAERVRWFGIDLDPRLAERLHRAATWRALLADASRGLPFRDGAFDVVLCEQVLEHLDDPAAALREIARVLRPGGLLVAGVPTFPPGVAALRDAAARVVSRDDAHHGHGHVRTFSAPSFRRLVAATGAFDVVSVRGFRAASGGLLAPLEDRAWWWRLNRAVFGALPWFAAEVQVVALRSGVSSPAGAGGVAPSTAATPPSR
jgi:SAM-dependent methyltransferase